ncbi:hypothetical protein PsYK624_144360 [Phanerochaete sordida]|uniref:Uncharacterized protein n=1 Tax=Phanerochaete sordida TaxID=48140 RepID=A0A9P3GMM7_9APHY|nr:hypothetical protein PsYK624_144360 [Phanerochaete sordida]
MHARERRSAPAPPRVSWCIYTFWVDISASLSRVDDSSWEVKIFVDQGPAKSQGRWPVRRAAVGQRYTS